MDKRLVIVGGGAAGICAAISAARQGKPVVICEKMPQLGKKILATGNGRCNLLNDDLSEANYNPAGRYQSDPNTGKIIRIIDSAMFSEIETIDIGPNTPQTLQLVVKRQGNTDIYMDNALNLMSQTFQQPANKLSGLNFRLEIYIRAENGKSKPVRFIMRNLGNNLQDVTLHEV